MGAGGAARASVVALLDEGVPEVRLCNRTQEKAQALKDAFGDRVTVVPWAERNSAMAGVRLLVNTTTQGMHGQPALDVALDDLPAEALVSDAIYIPLETPLLAAARQRGVGILLISADFDEILEMSDRILVCFEGQIMGEYSGKNPPIEEISLAMTGK